MATSFAFNRWIEEAIEYRHRNRDRTTGESRLKCSRGVAVLLSQCGAAVPILKRFRVGTRNWLGGDDVKWGGRWRVRQT